MVQAPATAMIDRAAELRAIPREITPDTVEATRAVYMVLHRQPDLTGLRVELDLAYGSDPRHRLDVYAPADASRLPVLVFVHGGGFIGGDKREASGLFFENIGVWAARHGFVGVNITYRLAPDHPWPAGGEDVAAATAWIAANIAERGGDPSRIILFGHSAGATHVGTFMSEGRFAAQRDARVRALVLHSGIYVIAGRELAPPRRAYFGDRPELYAARSPVHGLAKTKLPLLVAVSELDPPAVHDQALRLVGAACDAGNRPQLSYLADHNHFSPVLHFNLPDEGQLERAVLDFSKELRS